MPPQAASASGRDGFLETDRGHGLVEARERELGDRFGREPGAEGCDDALREQDLAALRVAAQGRSEVGQGADRAIVPAALEADLVECRIALCDAYAKLDVVSALLPADCERLEFPLHVE